MNIPYRNAMKNTKDFVLNKNTTYSQGTKFKPSGFWYQINDCGYKHRQVEDGVPNWGKYIYKVEIDTSNILVIKNYQDYLKFDRKYGFDTLLGNGNPYDESLFSLIENIENGEDA